MRKNSIIMLSLRAVLVAVYVVLSMCAIPVGGLKFTFEHFPVVLAAVIYGPIDAVVIGGVGEFINQMLTFGITPTTVLWILPIVVRGLVIGLFARWFKNMSATAIMKKRIPIAFIILCVVSGLLSSLLNTFVLYVDSKMFGYYSFAMVFGALAVRLLTSAITSLVIGIAIKSILHALSRAKLI